MSDQIARKTTGRGVERVPDSSRGRLDELAVGALAARRVRFPRAASTTAAERAAARGASPSSGRVSTYMSTNVSPVQMDTSLVAAAREMRISGVGAVPVLDSAGEACVGVLTERDIVVRVLAEERDPRAAAVGDVASPQPVTSSPNDDIMTAIAQMGRAEIQYLPVVAEGCVVGVISLADIVFGHPDEERGTIAPPHVRSR